MTRWDVLKYAIAFALRGASKIVRGLKQDLTEAERYAVAEHVVTQLKERGDPWHLSEEAQPKARPDNALSGSRVFNIWHVFGHNIFTKPAAHGRANLLQRRHH